MIQELTGALLTHHLLEGVALSYALVCTRTLALIIWLPFLYYGTIPRRLSVVFALHLSMIVMWGVGLPAMTALSAKGTPGMLEVVGMMFGEAFLGCALGVSVRLMIDGARSMGSLLSQAIGLAFASFVDPSMGGSASILERLSWLLMLMVVLITGAHLEMLRIFMHGFELFPPGQVPVLMLDPMEVVTRSSALFVVALKLSAPVLAVSFMVYASMAILVKVSPSMNLFVFGFALTIPGGLFALWLSSPQTIMVMMEQSALAVEAMREVLIAWSP